MVHRALKFSISGRAPERQPSAPAAATDVDMGVTEVNREPLAAKENADASEATQSEPSAASASNARREPKRQKTEAKENPCHVPLYDIDGQLLEKVGAAGSAVHPDLVGLVSLAIQAEEKKVGNVVLFSIQLGRGKEWKGLYGKSPLKYKFSNALAMFTKAGARCLKVHLEGGAKREHFDYTISNWLASDMGKLEDEVLTKYYEALNPRCMRSDIEAAWARWCKHCALSRTELPHSVLRIMYISLIYIVGNVYVL